jgi:hypothetical protein
MGLAGLTAVFGMGTGVTPPVWSPESRPAGGQAGPGAIRVGRSHAKGGALSPLTLIELITVRSVGPRVRGGRIGVVKLLGC